MMSRDICVLNVAERVITNSEQKTAEKLHKLKPGEVTRTNHGGTTYETYSPTSTESKYDARPQMDY